MKASHQDDPLRRLGKKALRRLARQYKIKHFYRKSPASLRRAIRRAQLRSEQAAGITPLTPEELADQRRAAEVKAFEEHRLRYLFLPSRFVHKGTHEEYLLEKDEDIELPDYYQENELTAMPIDPYRFYVYWDFDEDTLYDVRSWLAEDNIFQLRIHDVSSLVFDGSNAHQSWESSCHPLVREWYLNAPVNGRDLIVELGVVLPTGFRVLLSSNPLYVPPATVSPVTGDVFARFVPGQPLPTDELRPVPETPVPQPKPETSAHLFFQEYVPTPVQFNPAPPPRQILRHVPNQRPVQANPDPSFIPDTPLHQPGFAPAQPLPQPVPQPFPQQGRQPLPQPVQISEPAEWVAVREQIEAPQTESRFEIQTDGQPGPESGEQSWTEADVIRYLSEGGSMTLHEWLGLPHEIRWLSDMPMGMSPIFFEHWIDNPYDRALMISYAIWPWEITEYLPLGSSDWTLRKFLGASLFSWYRPGGSERMVWWQQPLGGSEGIRWERPLGSSDISWSGDLQISNQPGRSAWELWPAPSSSRGLHTDSGVGFFGSSFGSSPISSPARKGDE